MLKCFIFRINKIVADISLYHFLSWKSVFSEINVNVTKKQWNIVADSSRRAAARELLKMNKVIYNENLFNKLIEKKNAIFIHLLKEGLTPKNIYPGISEILDEIKNRGYLLACGSSSENATLQLKRMKLFSKFDYVIDYKDIERKLILGDNDEKDYINPSAIILDKLKLQGSECIGFEQDIKGLEQYRVLGIFSVYVGDQNKKKKNIADFSVPFSGGMSLEEIIFNYYKIHDEGEKDV